VILFLLYLKSVVEKKLLRNPTTCENGYRIVYRDFLLYNILFNNIYNIIGIIDWKYVYSVLFKVFATLTNIYSHFDPKALRTVSDRDKEGRQYIKDIMDKEKGIQGRKLSKVFGNILGDIGFCITYFEERRAVLFGKLLDYYEK
jgi:hypothetical protein